MTHINNPFPRVLAEEVRIQWLKLDLEAKKLIKIREEMRALDRQTNEQLRKYKLEPVKELPPLEIDRVVSLWCHDRRQARQVSLLLSEWPQVNFRVEWLNV